jgi:hypothetical protein
MHNIPGFFNLLSDADKSGYTALRQVVSSDAVRYNRHQRIRTFLKIMDNIRGYCESRVDDSWVRYLVCGICWMGSGEFAVNTHQLRLLIGKSKSTINGVLAKMGYRTHALDDNALIEKIPMLANCPRQLRQWTTRRKPENKTETKEPETFDGWEQETYECEMENDDIAEWIEMALGEAGTRYPGS